MKKLQSNLAHTDGTSLDITKRKEVFVSNTVNTLLSASRSPPRDEAWQQQENLDMAIV